MTQQPLLPAQQQALDALERSAKSDFVAELSARSGSGKTTILRKLHERLGGVLLTSGDFIEASADRHPLALDETTYLVLSEALREHDVVIIDDFHFISQVACCSHSYPRSNFLGAALVPLATKAKEEGKVLIFGG